MKYLDIYYTNGFGGTRVHRDVIETVGQFAIYTIPRIGECVGLGNGKYWYVTNVIHSPSIPSIEIILKEAT